MKLPAGTLTNLIPIEFVIESASWQQTAYGHEVTTSNKTSLLKLKLKLKGVIEQLIYVQLQLNHQSQARTQRSSGGSIEPPHPEKGSA